MRKLRMHFWLRCMDLATWTAVRAIRLEKLAGRVHFFCVGRASDCVDWEPLPHAERDGDPW